MSARVGRLSILGGPRVRRLRAIGSANERVAFGLLGFVGISIIWEVASNTGLFRKSLLSSPTLIWKAATTDFGNGTIWPHITTSLSESNLGFIIATATGIPLGLFIGMFCRVDYFASVILSGT